PVVPFTRWKSQVQSLQRPRKHLRFPSAAEPGLVPPGSPRAFRSRFPHLLRPNASQRGGPRKSRSRHTSLDDLARPQRTHRTEAVLKTLMLYAPPVPKWTPQAPTGEPENAEDVQK